MRPDFSYALTAWIVRGAAGIAPRIMRDRFEEEWLADLAALDGYVRQLRFVLGCCRAALAMRSDRFNTPPARTGSAVIDEPFSVRPRMGGSFRFIKRRERIREEAFTWLERLCRGLRNGEGSELRTWLRWRSHRAGIARVAAQRDRQEELAVLGKLFHVDPSWLMPRQGRGFAMNATVVLIALCLTALPLFYTHHSMSGLTLGPDDAGSLLQAQGRVYDSGPRTVRRIGFPDGTQVVMNRGTRIAVLYAEHIHTVLLVRGEATFTVSRQARPSFDLTVGDRRFGTLASTFNVRISGRNAFELTVLDGTVTNPAVVATVSPEALREGGAEHSAPALLRARQMIVTGSGEELPQTLSPSDVQARVAWQQG